jgi:hypothetical protein
MFKKLVIANRGEIAMRIVHACRDLGVTAVALYEPPDRNSLHVRLADECLRLDTPRGFMDPDAIVRLARACGADALHPGYGFLAEEADLIDACAAPGSPSSAAGRVRARTARQTRRPAARAAGFCDAGTFGDLFGPGWRGAGSGSGRIVSLLVKSCRGGQPVANAWCSSPNAWPRPRRPPRSARGVCDGTYSSSTRFCRRTSSACRYSATRTAA